MSNLHVPNPDAGNPEGSVPVRIPVPAAAQVSLQADQPISAVRRYLLSRGSSSVADRIFTGIMLLCALVIFALVALIATELITQSHLSWHAFGLSFFYRFNVDPITHLPLFWDPVNGVFYALPFIYGTLITSLVALCIAVPLAIGLAIFLTEMCPRWLRSPLSFFTELLAAIPSVVYGLWAIFVLVPLLRDNINPIFIRIFQLPLLERLFGWTHLFGDNGLFGGVNLGLGLLGAGAILAIMILPIIAALTREVMSAVPNSQREAALALGATRWEMIRMAVLRNARIGIVGSIILGLGRALGETMAVAMVIGNSPEIHLSLLSMGHSMASVIANEFTEATSDMHRSALIEVGLALFLVTIIVNAFARLLVWAVTRGAPARVQ